MIVGIDPSTFHLAWCWKHPTVTPTFWLEKRHLRKRGEKFGPDVVHNAFMAGLHLADTLPDRNAQVFLEAPVLGRSSNATIVQAMVSGAVQVALVEAGCTVHLVNNQTWKAEIKAKGHKVDPKSAISRAVEAHWPKAYRAAAGDQDLVDAIGIFIYGERILERAAGMGS